MKIVLFLTLLFPFFYSSYSQPFGNAVKGYRILRLDYSNGSGELGNTWFRYGYHGNLEKAYWTLADGTRSSMNTFETNADGKVISTFRKFSDSTSSIEIFEYDADGNKTAEKFLRSNGLIGKAIYSYDHGILKTAKFNAYKGWFTGDAKFFCNAGERLDSAVVTKEGKTLCTIRYFYDTHGNLSREYWDFLGNWYQDFRYVYEKSNSTGNFYASPYPGLCSRSRIKMENYNFNDKLKGPSYYFYNEAGELERKTFERSDGFMTTTRYEYDSCHRLKSSWRNVMEGRTLKFNYSYNAENRLVLRSSHCGDTLCSFESYQYNSGGELISASLWNMDGWLSGTILFINDFLGWPVSGVYSGTKGEKAIIRFGYNRDKELVNIRWDFTGGDFQEYLYQYETNPDSSE